MADTLRKCIEDRSPFETMPGEILVFELVVYIVDVGSSERFYRVKVCDESGWCEMEVEKKGYLGRVFSKVQFEHEEGQGKPYFRMVGRTVRFTNECVCLVKAFEKVENLNQLSYHRLEAMMTFQRRKMRI